MCSRPRTARRTRPAPSRTRMCFEVELSEIGKAAATSVTRLSGSAGRARIARRVGSATAEKTRSSTTPGCSPMRVNIVRARQRSQPLPALLSVPCRRGEEAGEALDLLPEGGDGLVDDLAHGRHGADEDGRFAAPDHGPVEPSVLERLEERPGIGVPGGVDVTPEDRLGQVVADHAHTDAG